MGNKGLTADEVKEKAAGAGVTMTLDEVKTLLDTLKAKAGSTGKPITLKAFKKMAASLREQMPNVDAFKDEYVEQCFRQLDSDNSGKVDVVELVTGIVILSRGSTEQKAELVFKAIDKNNDGSLTKLEVENYLNVTYNAVQEKMLNDSKKDGLPWVLRTGLSIGLKTMRPTLRKEFLEEVFEADTDSDGKITLEEFKAAAAGSNSAINQLLSPDEFVEGVHSTMSSACDEAGLITGSE